MKDTLLHDLQNLKVSESNKQYYRCISWITGHLGKTSTAG